MSEVVEEMIEEIRQPEPVTPAHLEGRDINRENQRPGSARFGLGGLLIVLGVALLAVQLLDIRFGRFLWPFYVIVPGVLLFIFALFTGGELGEGLSAFGGMVTMTGVLLLYQNSTGHWESWAYAWALIAPASVGLAHTIYGGLRGRGNLIRSGIHLVTIGVILFLVGGIFFEAIIGISGFGFRLSGLVWPMILIGLGVFMLIGTFLPARKKV